MAQLTCLNCSRVFHTQRGLSVHHTNMHNGTSHVRNYGGPFACPQCNGCFTIKASLVRHMNSHRPLVACLQCPNPRKYIEKGLCTSCYNRQRPDHRVTAVPQLPPVPTVSVFAPPAHQRLRDMLARRRIEERLIQRELRLRAEEDADDESSSSSDMPGLMTPGWKHLTLVPESDSEELIDEEFIWSNEIQCALIATPVLCS